MAFQPVFHPPVESVRFGRVLPVEIAPASGRQPCRYCEVLAEGSRSPARTHFSVPAVTARAVLRRIERGAAVDAVVLGGAGEPLRQRGLGSVLRRIRTVTHLPAILLTNGVLLGDREVRREVTEADTVVAWLPALRDDAGGAGARRANEWERHVEGIASLRREAQVRIVLEIPVRAGGNGPESRDAWRRAAKRIRPDRVFVMPERRAEDVEPATLEAVRKAIHPAARVHLREEGLIDRRCWCDPAFSRSAD